MIENAGNTQQLDFPWRSIYPVLSFYFRFLATIMFWISPSQHCLLCFLSSASLMSLLLQSFQSPTSFQPKTHFQFWRKIIGWIINFVSLSTDADCSAEYFPSFLCWCMITLGFYLCCRLPKYAPMFTCNSQEFISVLSGIYCILILPIFKYRCGCYNGTSMQKFGTSLYFHLIISSIFSYF